MIGGKHVSEKVNLFGAPSRRERPSSLSAVLESPPVSPRQGLTAHLYPESGAIVIFRDAETLPDVRIGLPMVAVLKR